MITAVVFDYGKVICLPPPDSVLDGLARLAGLDAAVLDALRWKYRDGYDRGALSGAAYYRKILREAGRDPDADVAAAMAGMDMAGWTAMNPGTLALMADVKRAGLTLGVLSNMPEEFLARARRELGVFSLYDVGIFSCELGLVKPEPDIYRALITALGAAPEEIVFFDDVAINVEAAAAVGIRAFQWTDPVRARILLRENGAAV